MQSEHPPQEAETVIARGRVLGGLEPTRVRSRLSSAGSQADLNPSVQAFGDARYKWPVGLQERLAAAFHVRLAVALGPVHADLAPAAWN